MTGMSLIVKKTTQLLSGPIFIYGIYIIVHGHLSPGGGFDCGALIAGSFILLILSNGSEYLKLKRKEEGSAFVESIAIMAFLLMAVIGMFLGSLIFFHNFIPQGTTGDLISAGFIPLCNILIGIEVAAALLSIYYAFVIYKEEILK
jgi:multicomponent Na+:H+ antiporter subunit B